MSSTNLTQFTEYESRGRHEASEEEQQSQECQELILSLPKQKNWRSSHLYLFQGFWYPLILLQPIINFQNQFQAKDSDVVVASFPKSGTTWLKALTFAIGNRQCFSSLENHPLLTFNPHQLVPFFEFSVFGNIVTYTSHQSSMTNQRLFGTHISFHRLAKSIKESNCKIIYICRNLFDTFVSWWMFSNKLMPELLPVVKMEEAFEMYCNGIHDFGPWWDHILGYWKESIARPNKVLFLKYEDLKDDVHFHTKRIAEFLGCPFTQEEESSGVIDNIIKICSFDEMKNLEVNKSEILGTIVETKYLFRKGEVGDSVNYLSPPMVEKLSKIVDEKLNGSGLFFSTHKTIR